MRTGLLILFTSVQKTEKRVLLKRSIGKTRRCDGPDLHFDSCQHSHEFLPYLVVGFSLAGCGGRKMIIRRYPCMSLMLVWTSNGIFDPETPLCRSQCIT